MRAEDRLIASCKSWDEFFENAKTLPTNDQKGAVFERLTQLYLETSPEYQAELQSIWPLRDVPVDVRNHLNLPAPDEGIDIIAQTRRKEYWAIQCKFRSQDDRGLTRRELGTFTSLAFQTCDKIALAVVAHTSNKPVGKRQLLRNTVEIGLDRWQSLDDESQNGQTGWSLILGRLRGRRISLKARKPRPHQKAAINAAMAHFHKARKPRGRMIMPCGTGKSLAAFWIAQSLKAKNVLVAVPSLALIRQSLADWTREFLAHGKRPDWLCVCSDESVGNLERDEFVGEVYELGLPTHTDPKDIAAFLDTPFNAPKIVFTTYQSSPQLAAGAQRAHFTFDLAILDEAHKTVGHVSKPFATLLNEKKIKIRRRIFMTATERVFRGDSDDVLSMDDDAKEYGPRFYQLSFKEAIKQNIISDYRIITATVSDLKIRKLIEENRLLNFESRDLAVTEAQSVAAGIALKRVFRKYKVRHAISFHRSIKSADQFREQQDALNGVRYFGPKTTNLHISSKKTAGQRSELLRDFVRQDHALMTNARCLTEGVDIPAIDCVLFADPKQSKIDIVQATGRALRRFEGKDYGYIIVPLVVPTNMNFDEFAETTAFRQVARTITALSTQDERIAEEFRAIEKGRVSSGKIVEIEGDIPIGMKLKLEDFADAISTRVWESVGRVNWRPFEEARAFVHGLGLKNLFEWRDYLHSGRKPADIPADPNKVYVSEGWAGFGDWLGTGTIAPFLRKFRPFNKARAFVRNLGLKSAAEWRNYCKSGKKPDDIPACPNVAYAGEGWSSFGDWLGTGVVADRLREYRSFKSARAFARRLRLKTVKEWSEYCRSGKRPDDIPANPQNGYANEGWFGWGDWLGTGAVAHRVREFRSFKKARAFVHGLDLKSVPEWRDYCKSGKKPDDIPFNADRTYASEGWAGWGDWLGTGNVATFLRKFRPFKSARAFARGLRLKSWEEWEDYCQSGKKPPDIPAAPYQTYASEGWIGIGDWLGTGAVAPSQREFRPFKKARAFARGLKLKSFEEWFEYCKSHKKPDDIPSNPSRTYANKGWAGWGDWLETGNVATFLRKFRPFNKARAFVRNLGLRSAAEWRNYCKSGKKPPDIPAAPYQTYASEGWVGFGDWLGY